MKILDRLLKGSIRIYKRSPIKPFKSLIQKAFVFYKKTNKKKIYADVDDVSYHLDLSENVDSLIYYGSYEYKITNLFKKHVKPGMVVIDVGANIGYYTLLSAKLTNGQGKIIAFEPVKSTFLKLKENVSLNNFKNIILENEMVSDKTKRETVILPWSYNLDGSAIKKAEEVEVIKLDDYIKIKKLNKVDFLKIDVDGGELGVIKGAIKMMEKFKPLAIIELGCGEDIKKSEEILDLINKIGYRFYNEDDVEFKNVKEVKQELKKYSCAIDVLAKPILK